MTRDADPTADRGPQPEGSSEPTPAPLLRVISPNATPEEEVRGAWVTWLRYIQESVSKKEAISEPTPVRRTTPEWRSPHRTVRRTFPHGPGGWRSSGLPG